MSYRISPNKRSQSYVKYGQGAFILYSICKAKSLSNFEFLCILEICRMKYYSNWTKNSLVHLNIFILINLCSLSYSDIRIFLEGELLLGRALLLEEIWYALRKRELCASAKKESIHVILHSWQV